MTVCGTSRLLTNSVFCGFSLLIVHVPLFQVICAWRRETDGSDKTTSLPGSRPIVVMGLLSGNVVPAKGPVRNRIAPRLCGPFILSIPCTVETRLALLLLDSIWLTGKVRLQPFWFAS